MNFRIPSLIHNDELLEEYLNTKRKLEAEILESMKKGKHTTRKGNQTCRNTEFHILIIF